MRIATSDDIDAVTETIALAFATDPVWGPALKRDDGSAAHHIPFWRLFVEGALPHGMVQLTDDGAAVAVWIPPGRDEMTEAQVEELTAVVTANLGPAAQDAMFALWERFEEAQPQDEPHAYLSLLATHPEHRGRGIAQDLVRGTLAELDRQGLPAYLESTNPANDHRYERLGFVKTGGFEGSVPGSVVATMWRPVGG
jgi:ribosomal protein S18 acetylase RimI-like enzyme